MEKSNANLSGYIHAPTVDSHILRVTLYNVGNAKDQHPGLFRRRDKAGLKIPHDRGIVDKLLTGYRISCSDSWPTDEWSTAVLGFARACCGNSRPVADLNGMQWYSLRLSPRVLEVRQSCEWSNAAWKMRKIDDEWEIRMWSSRAVAAYAARHSVNFDGERLICKGKRRCTFLHFKDRRRVHRVASASVKLILLACGASCTRPIKF